MLKILNSISNNNKELFERALNIRKSEWGNTVTYSRKVLKDAIKKGGSSIRDFKNLHGNIGNFQKQFKVYQREGLSCKRDNCKGFIKRKIISNRSSFFCNICQK